MKSFSDIYDPKANCFDLLRIVFASAVIFGHTCPSLPSTSWDYKQITVQYLAVNGFFVISGFLVVQSLIRSGRFTDYLIKRTLRIMPGLLGSLVFVALVLGPLLTQVDLHSYFLGAHNNPFKFVLDQLTFKLTGNTDNVCDLFIGNPANGPLWTLRYEVLMYLLLPAIAPLILRYRFLSLTLTAVFGIDLALDFDPLIIGDQANLHRFCRLAFCFFIGVSIYLFRDRIPFPKKLLLYTTPVILFFYVTGFINEILLLIFPIYIIAIGIRWNISLTDRFGDFSYGFYIYGWPIQHTISDHLVQGINPVSLCALTFLGTIPLAAFSWYCIEKPALSLKHRLSTVQKRSRFTVGEG
ncbi:MAG: acyltransferase [Bacillota bacterium]